MIVAAPSISRWATAAPISHDDTPPGPAATASSGDRAALASACSVQAPTNATPVTITPSVTTSFATIHQYRSRPHAVPTDRTIPVTRVTIATGGNTARSRAAMNT